MMRTLAIAALIVCIREVWRRLQSQLSWLDLPQFARISLLGGAWRLRSGSEATQKVQQSDANLMVKIL